MKKYIIYSAKLVLSPFLYLNGKVKKTNWYKNVIPDKDNYPTNEWYREHSERNFDVVNVGSSSGVYAFDYSETGVKAFNWALQPQSMEYSFKVLKNYFSILREGGIVLIPFSPFSGLSVLGKWSKSANDKYYHILNRSLVDNYDNRARRRKYPLFYQPKQSLKRLIRDVPPKKDIRNCHICRTSADFDNDAECWLRNWKREFDIQDLNAPLSEENKLGAKSRKKTVQDMIAFCLERNLRPVLVIPPIHPSLANRLTPAFRENYIYSFIREANTSEIPFLDYTDAPAFRDDIYFSNSYFLSKKGAKEFTKMLLKELHKEL